VQRLAHRRAVWVAGFQTERGHAAELVHNLQYLRAGVHLADVVGRPFRRNPAVKSRRDHAGADRRPPLFATDARSGPGRADEGIPVTLITDPYCDWAPGLVTELFAVPTDLNHFWDTTSAMSSLIGLMVNGVFRELGAEVEAAWPASRRFTAISSDIPPRGATRADPDPDPTERTAMTFPFRKTLLSPASAWPP
jgi:hypothetical protein